MVEKPWKTWYYSPITPGNKRQHWYQSFEVLITVSENKIHFMLLKCNSNTSFRITLFHLASVYWKSGTLLSLVIITIWCQSSSEPMNGLTVLLCLSLGKQLRRASLLTVRMGCGCREASVSMNWNIFFLIWPPRLPDCFLVFEGGGGGGLVCWPPRVFLWGC
jgi:hypothetical protein